MELSWVCAFIVVWKDVYVRVWIEIVILHLYLSKGQPGLLPHFVACEKLVEVSVLFLEFNARRKKGLCD